MPQPLPPRSDPLDEAKLAWAQSSAHLAATLRNEPLNRPCLTVVAAPCPAVSAVAAILIAGYWFWTRTWHCACQWHLAFEIHPVFHAWHWAGATIASIIWQLWDRLKPRDPRRPLGTLYSLSHALGQPVAKRYEARVDVGRLVMTRRGS